MTISLYRVVLKMIIHRKEKSEVLLVQRNREPGVGKWALPGGVGALEMESDPSRAIYLEAESDFGARFTAAQIFTLRTEKGDSPTLCLYFEGELEDEPRIKSPNTTKEIRWVSKMDVEHVPSWAFENENGVVLEFLSSAR